MSLYVKHTSKPVEQAVQDLEAAVQRHGFGVLHTYDFRQTLATKGFPLAAECRVLEVCNPRQASEALGADMALNMALPCRVSVYQQGGQTCIGMIPPQDILALVSTDPAVAGMAGEVERAMHAIIDDAV